MFSGAEAPSHWFILAIVVVLLFGYKKLPDAARSIGRSLRIFKTEMKGMSEDEAARTAVAPAPPVTPVAPEAAIPPAAAPPAAPAPAAPAPAAPAPEVPAQPASAPLAPDAPVVLDKPVADPAVDNPTAPSAPPAT